MGRLDFQNMLFLYCQEPDSRAPYEFVPYRFGAFSFTSYSDRHKLIERGSLADDEQRWQLTRGGEAAIGDSQDLHMTAFVRRHRGVRGDALAAETYRRFPYYATRSEIVGRVLHGDPASLSRIEEASPFPTTSSISTIGYEGRTLESYLNELLRSGVTLLCDVRKNPISHKYGFSKGTLAKACQRMGIRYEHLPDLGIASEKRQTLESREDYEALFAEYERNSLPELGDVLSRIAGWVRRGEHVALTCYELSPRECHRRCVAEALEKSLGEGFSADHL